jgi:hypothetical protein
MTHAKQGHGKLNIFAILKMSLIELESLMNTKNDAWTKLYSQLSVQEKQEYAAFFNQYQEIKTKQDNAQVLTTDEFTCMKKSPEQSWVFEKIEQLSKPGLTGVEGQVTKFVKYNEAMVEHEIGNSAGPEIRPQTMSAEEMKKVFAEISNLSVKKTSAPPEDEQGPKP